MHAVNAMKQIVGYGDDSVKSGYREKLGGLFMGLGLTLTTLGKEVVSKGNAATIEKYIIDMDNYFKVECQPLDNDGSRQVCSMKIPDAPSLDHNTTDNILIGFSAFFEAMMMLILIRGIIRFYSVKNEAAEDASVPAAPRPPTVVDEAETTNLLV